MDINSINNLIYAEVLKKYGLNLPEYDESTHIENDNTINEALLKFLMTKEGYRKEKFEIEKSEHSITRQHISDKIDELAKKEDLIKIKDEIIDKIQTESAETKKHLEEQITDLKQCLSRYLPHKRTFRMSFYFTSIFSISIISNILFDIQIIHPFWAAIGLFVSCGFLIMSYFFFLDWKKGINDG